jgi:hypothetical protein
MVGYNIFPDLPYSTIEQPEGIHKYQLEYEHKIFDVSYPAAIAGKRQRGEKIIFSLYKNSPMLARIQRIYVEIWHSNFYAKANIVHKTFLSRAPAGLPTEGIKSYEELSWLIGADSTNYGLRVFNYLYKVYLVHPDIADDDKNKILIASNTTFVSSIAKPRLSAFKLTQALTSEDFMHYYMSLAGKPANDDIYARNLTLSGSLTGFAEHSVLSVEIMLYKCNSTDREDGYERLVTWTNINLEIVKDKFTKTFVLTGEDRTKFIKHRKENRYFFATLRFNGYLDWYMTALVDLDDTARTSFNKTKATSDLLLKI